MRVAFRADASLKIGTGHIYRCVALADRLRSDNAEVVFICRSLKGNILHWLQAEDFQTISLPQAAGDNAPPHADWLEVSDEQEIADCIAAIRRWGKPDWLIADHYGLGRWWDEAMRPEVGRIMVTDDLVLAERYADLLVNQNLGVCSEDYDRLVPETCRVLAGPRYAMLRPQFAQARRLARQTRLKLNNILISFGGVDRNNMTASAIDGVIAAGLADIAVNIVLGSLNQHADVIRKKCAEHANIVILQGVNDMASLMSKADLFCGAGGVITWERAALGLPGVTIAIAQNQIEPCVAMAGAGADIFLGLDENVGPEHVARELVCLANDPQKLQNMSVNAGAICDGLGAARISHQLANRGKIGVRPAVTDDCDSVFHWRNDQTVRSMSGNSGVLALDQHREWFARTLMSSSRVLLIGELPARRAVGVVRYDLVDDRATISIYLAPQYQGVGLGLELLNRADDWLLKHRECVTMIDAIVRPENVASRRMFAQAGYNETCGRFTKRLN